jgi:predicted transcriptional regulator
MSDSIRLGPNQKMILTLIKDYPKSFDQLMRMMMFEDVGDRRYCMKEALDKLIKRGLIIEEDGRYSVLQISRGPVDKSTFEGITVHCSEAYRWEMPERSERNDVGPV